MSYFFDDERLWKHVSLVGFAEHYVLNDEDGGWTPFAMFQRQKKARAPEDAIFGGVILNDWQDLDARGVELRVLAFKEAGIDYIRLHCDFGSGDALCDNPLCLARLRWLAEVAQICQRHEMVPLALLQLPWRETQGASTAYFKQAVEYFAAALKKRQVDPKKMLYETRPPMTLSAQEEKALGGAARVSMGLAIGETMFEVISEAFDGDPIAGFCIAGGSTKGAFPQAMENDTQNAVRQGMRRRARRRWGYDVCFWEMGAKLMLQPKVGQFWGKSRAERDAARELFLFNAQNIAKEVATPLS